jgi:hypothetical protein
MGLHRRTGVGMEWARLLKLCLGSHTQQTKLSVRLVSKDCDLQ